VYDPVQPGLVQVGLGTVTKLEKKIPELFTSTVPALLPWPVPIAVAKAVPESNTNATATPVALRLIDELTPANPTFLRLFIIFLIIFSPPV
jgi:hypothetical protein